MRFYTKQHPFYCGIDLHARSMYVCIVNHDGAILVHRNMKAAPEPFLKAVAPYRDGLVVAVECIFPWYWLADLCTQEGIPFVLGHALYMKAIHGGKAKNGKIDLPEIGKKIAYKANRAGVAERFPDPAVQKSMEVDLALIDYYDPLLNDVELSIVRLAKQHDPDTFYRLQSVPGIGKILSLVLLYEIHDSRRFPRVQDFLSYCRLVKCAKESAGKRYGTSGAKIGNAYLKWAFSEAAVLFLRDHPAGQKYLTKLENTHGQGKALTLLAQKLARAVYYMLTRHTAFDLHKFLHA
jgi:transposase